MLEIFQPSVLVPWILGMVFGIFVGGIPGLTATMAVALAVPVTYHLAPIAGLAMIIGISCTAIFAGDIPATFMRIPGTPSSGAAVLDGYAMAEQGKGSLALALDLLGSTIGGLIGFALLIFVSRPLAGFALQFTNFEYFWLGMFGLSMSAVITTGSTNKGFISAFLGLLIATIGVDVTTGYPRFAFGNPELMDGIEFIPAMIGLFGISEVFRYMMRPEDFERPTVIDKLKLSFDNVTSILWKFKATIARSAVIGTFIGALPGAGADIAAWVAYGLGKRMSKHPEKFGTGYEEGVIAPTAANNAALGGTWIPALVFGIPGDTITAIVLGAMLMYGLKPGPLIFQQSPDLVNKIFAVGIISQLFMVGIGFLGIKGFSYILKIPSNVIMPAVMGFSIVGSFALRNSAFDILVMLVFGILGFLMERSSIPLPPLILGLILGPMIEDNLRVGLLKTGGKIGPFITRPICSVLIVILVAVLFGEQIIKTGRRMLGKSEQKGQINT